MNGQQLYALTTAEWRALHDGATIDGKLVDWSSVSHFLESTVKYGAHETRTIHAFLRIPVIGKVEAYHQWYPLLLRWNYAKPQFESVDRRLLDDIQRVYFKSDFHCFDCGFDFAGFAVSQDDYWLDRMTPPLIRYGYEAAGCPRCGGPARYPGLVEIFDLEQS